MAKNTYKYTVNKWIDIPHHHLSSSLISKLEGLETYKDQVLKEHFYGIDLVERFQEEGKIINSEEQADLDKINGYLIKEDAAYFRIVS